ncbi:MAG: DUF302 domain-containing protein [Amphiplicatus sp.]
MSYYIAKTVTLSFDDAVAKVKQALAREGFGVLTEIDVKATLKTKLDVDFSSYVILGACNPGLAHKALQAEDKIGVLLPCNVIIREAKTGAIEVATVDPVASMSAVDNPALENLAGAVKEKLRRVIHAL